MSEKDLIEVFVATLSGHTRRAYQKDLREVFGESGVLEVLSDERLLQQRLRSISPSVSRRRVSAVNSFSRWLASTGQGPPNRFSVPAVVQTPTTRSRIDALRDEDVQILFRAIAPGPTETRDRALLILFLTTGLRASEIVGLNHDDVVESPFGGRLRIRNTRGERNSWVVISKRLYATLLGLGPKDRPAGQPIFTSASNNSRWRRLTSQSAYRILRKISARAGIKQVNTDVLRMTSLYRMLLEVELVAPGHCHPQKS